MPQPALGNHDVTALIALTRTNIEGTLVVVSAFVLFFGSVWLLLAAVFGVRMGYLVAATGLFGFLLILSSMWVFGAPGTPRFLGPKGDLPAWIGLAEGETLTSSTFPAIEEYPGGEWETADEAKEFRAEMEAATLALQDFLAEEANAELKRARIEGEVPPESFEIADLRFTQEGETPLAAARGFASTGGPEVTVVAYKDPGNEGVPSYLFLAAAVLGLVIHLPFLDRAERKRKDVLTGGDQGPWRGPA